jgi:hypothetical protein
MIGTTKAPRKTKEFGIDCLLPILVPLCLDDSIFVFFVVNSLLFALFAPFPQDSP